MRRRTSTSVKRKVGGRGAKVARLGVFENALESESSSLRASGVHAGRRESLPAGRGAEQRRTTRIPGSDLAHLAACQRFDAAHDVEGKDRAAEPALRVCGPTGKDGHRKDRGDEEVRRGN